MGLGCDEQQIRLHTVAVTAADAQYHAITINCDESGKRRKNCKAYAQNQEMKWVPFIDFTNHMACFKIEQTVCAQFKVCHMN